MASYAQQNRQNPGVPLPKILRIGVVLGGKIVEEKLIRKRDTVTIGQSAKNTFAVPAPELPKTFPIFQMTPQGYMLNFVDGMDGRISDGDNIYPLLQMRQNGNARQNGAYWTLPLIDRARGKITIGDLTLLFQFVTPPPPAAKPQLPHSVRGSLLDRIDPYLAVAMLFSLVLHSVFVLYARATEKEKNVDISIVPSEEADRFAHITPPKPKIVLATNDKGVGKAEPVAGPAKTQGGEDHTPKQPKNPKPDDHAGDDKEPGAREARVSQQVASNTVLQVLGRRTASGSGTIFDVSDGRDPGIDTAKALASAQKISGPSTPGGGKLGGTRGGNETGTVAGGKGVTIGGPSGTTDTGTKTVEKVIKADVKGGKAESDNDDALPGASIAAKIRSAYMGGIKGCYERGLKQNPDMAGRVDIEFTIGAMGTVTKSSISSSELNNPTVESCIKSAAKSWAFNRPKDGESVTVTYPFVFHASSR